MAGFVLGKLMNGAVWKRLLKERLAEPLHVNVIAASSPSSETCEARSTSI
jgi:hypothetical protein